MPKENTETSVPRHVLHVTMLGPTGVGKTSLLASLYDQFQLVSGQANLVMIADGETRGVLQGYREQLKKFARGLDRDPGIARSGFFREHNILLGTGGPRKPQMMLCFTDVPGEALNSGGAMASRLQETVDRSVVLFVAIDSPALIERDGKFHEEVNQPGLVADFVRSVATQGRDLLVVLVPLKCEAYMQHREDRLRLRARVTESYYPMVGQLSGFESSSCGVVVTPVQTVGSMIFSGFDPDGTEHVTLKHLGASYSPSDTDQPLRWMLRFVVSGYRRRDRTWLERLGEWYFGDDGRFVQALRVFGEGTKVDPEWGFEVLLRHKYLELS
jgi:hypothetical protein